MRNGDLYHYPEERTLKRVPTAEFNVQQTIASRAAIDAFLTRSRAQLWSEHDYTANAKLKKAPQFYDLTSAANHGQIGTRPR